MASISPFNILLNRLSNNMSTMNLQSLVDVCGEEFISEPERERILKDPEYGRREVFKILRRRNAIGDAPRKMAFLLRIIKELRPKRPDLVNMVKTYIEDHYEEPPEILNDFEFSSDDYVIIPRPSSTIPEVDCCGKDCCNVRCGCCSCNCGCNPCCSTFCCVMLVALLLVFTAFVIVLFWYILPFSSRPLNENDNFKVVGRVMLCFLLFVAFCFIVFGVYIKRRKTELSYLELQGDISPDYGSLNSSSDSIRPTCPVYVKKIERGNGRRCSCSSGHITASSSYDSLNSARGNRPIPEAAVVTDGYRKRDVDFPREMELAQEDETTIC